MCWRREFKQREQMCKEPESGKPQRGGLHEDRGIHLVHNQAPSTTTPGTNETLYKYLVARMSE